MSLSTSLLPSPTSLKLPLATPLRPSSLYHLLRTKPLTPKPSRRLRCNAQLLSDVAPAAAATYGALLLTGGVFAYVRSRSKGSILGGATGGVLLAAAYYLMQTPETKAAGDALAFGSAFLFSAVFGIRLVASKKIVPAGALLALSLGSLAVFVSAYLQDKV